MAAVGLATTLVAVFTADAASATSGPVTSCGDKVYSAQCPANDVVLNDSVQRVQATSTMTATDKAIWSSRPDVTTGLIDPSQTQSFEDGDPDYIGPNEVDMSAGSLTANRTQSIAASSYATRSRTKDRYIRYADNFGNLCFQWHSTVTWNYNGTKVTSTPSRTNYLVVGKWCSGTVHNKGFTTNSAMAHLPGPYAYRVTLQGEVQQCIPKLWCSTDNPAVRYGVYKDGTYSYVVVNK